MAVDALGVSVETDDEGLMSDATVLYIVIGLAAGVLSGIFGIGGGVVIVPALIYFGGFTQHRATGTSLAVLLPPLGIGGCGNTTVTTTSMCRRRWSLLQPCSPVVGSAPWSQTACRGLTCGWPSASSWSRLVS